MIKSNHCRLIGYSKKLLFVAPFLHTLESSLNRLMKNIVSEVFCTDNWNYGNWENYLEYTLCQRVTDSKAEHPGELMLWQPWY